MCIRDRIKANQKKLLADNYSEVIKFLNELAEKKNAVGEKVVLPSSCPVSYTHLDVYKRQILISQIINNVNFVL